LTLWQILVSFRVITVLFAAVKFCPMLKLLDDVDPDCHDYIAFGFTVGKLLMGFI